MRRWYSCLFMLLCLVALPVVAEASHFRFAHITWKPRPDLGTNKVEIKVQEAWRRDDCPGTGPGGFLGVGDVECAGSGGKTLLFGDGTTVAVTGTVTSIDVTANWYIAEFKVIHTYPSAKDPSGNPWVAQLSSCCRIHELKNAPDGSFDVETTIDLSVANSSPVSAVPPIVSMALNNLNEITLPVADADGDSVSCALAGTASGIPSQPSLGGKSLAVSSSCALSWQPTDTTNESLGSLWATQVIITETRGGTTLSRVALDFIIQIVESIGNPPVFDFPPTPTGTAIVTAGTLYTAAIQGSDPDSGNTLTLNTTGVPAGATLSQGLPYSSASPVSTVLNWTPTNAQAGVYPLSFSVTDNFGQQAIHSFTIEVRPDSDGDGVADASDNCDFVANPGQEDGDGDGVGDSCDNCLAIANSDQEDVDENSVGDACELTGTGPGGEEEQTFPPGENVENEYRAGPFPGQTEQETLVVKLGQVTNTTLCSVDFRLVLLTETALQLKKLNQIRDAQGKPRLRQIEYTDANHNERGYGIRYEIECQVDEDNNGTGDRQAIPGQDYDRPTIAFTFHAEIDGQFGVVQEQTLHQTDTTPTSVDGLPAGWDFETDFPTFAVDQYDTELQSSVAKSSCDCVGTASPDPGFSWFIAVESDLTDPDGGGPATSDATQLVVLSPSVKVVDGKEKLVNTKTKDGSFQAGKSVGLTVRLKYEGSGGTVYINDPSADLTATVKRVVNNDVDAAVALQGFLDVWVNGTFAVDAFGRGYYTYTWQTVDPDTGAPLPPGIYTITIASKYTAAKPFVIELK